jgi:flagellar motor switch protein FliM
MWVQVKHHITMNNKDFRINEMKRLTEGFVIETVDNWKNDVQHVKKTEEEIWKEDLGHQANHYLLHVTVSHTTKLQTLEKS